MTSLGEDRKKRNWKNADFLSHVQMGPISKQSSFFLYGLVHIFGCRARSACTWTCSTTNIATELCIMEPGDLCSYWASEHLLRLFPLPWKKPSFTTVCLSPQHILKGLAQESPPSGDFPKAQGISNAPLLLLVPPSQHLPASCGLFKCLLPIYRRSFSHISTEHKRTE